MWCKAGISQLCHTGPIQPTSRLGRWYFWVRGPWVHTAVLEGARQASTYWTRTLHSASRGPLICSSRSRKQHPSATLALILTESAAPLRVLERRATVCHTPCSRYDFAVGFDLWSFTTEAHQITWFSQVFRKGLEVVTRCAGSCHGTIA